MDGFRELPNEEFDRDWADLRKKILNGQQLPFFINEGNPLPDPRWRRVAIGDDIFTRGPTRDMESFWPDDPMDLRSPFEPLFWTLKERGIDEFIISSRIGDSHLDHSEKSPEFNRHVIVDSNYDAVQRCGKSRIFGNGMFVPYLAFSRDGTWALACNTDSSSVLGGEPDFIEAFCRNAGGEHAVMMRFVRYDDSECWGYYMDDPGGPETIATWYGWMNWPVPDYPVWDWTEKYKDYL